MGKNLPYATGSATVSIAAKPHGYWRRDPESNRARRICNPASALSVDYATEGEASRLGRMDGRFCLKLSKKLPDPHYRMYCIPVHGYNHSLSTCAGTETIPREPPNSCVSALTGGARTPETQQLGGSLRFRVRAPSDVANGRCSRRTQDSYALTGNPARGLSAGPQEQSIRGDGRLAQRYGALWKSKLTLLGCGSPEVRMAEVGEYHPLGLPHPLFLLHEYRLNRPVSQGLAHAGFDALAYSNDHRFRTSALLWHGRSSSNESTYVLWHK